MTFKAVEMVAELMALSARTAPKGRGQDSIVIRVVTGKELVQLSQELRRLGEARGIKFFLRDAGNLERSEACLLLGSKAADIVGLDCGGCGYATCKEMLEAQKPFWENVSENPSTAPIASSRWPTSALLWDRLPRRPACTTSIIASCSRQEWRRSP